MGTSYTFVVNIGTWALERKFIIIKFSYTHFRGGNVLIGTSTHKPVGPKTTSNSALHEGLVPELCTRVHEGLVSTLLDYWTELTGLQDRVLLQLPVWHRNQIFTHYLQPGVTLWKASVISPNHLHLDQLGIGCERHSSHHICIIATKCMAVWDPLPKPSPSWWWFGLVVG